MTGGAQGGVDLVVRERPEGWSVELTRFHGKNIVRCEIMSGGQRTPLIGAYLLPSALDKLLDIEEALNVFPGRGSIVVG